MTVRGPDISRRSLTMKSYGSLLSVSKYHGPDIYTRVKTDDCLNLRRAFVLSLKRLDILCAWIRDTSEMLWHLTFSRASIVHFRASWYIMNLTHTNESKFMAVWILWELTCSILSVSIYYETELKIRVKIYNHLNFSRTSMIHFWVSRNIMDLTYTPESKVMPIWIF